MPGPRFLPTTAVARWRSPAAFCRALAISSPSSSVSVPLPFSASFSAAAGPSLAGLAAPSCTPPTVRPLPLSPPGGPTPTGVGALCRGAAYGSGAAEPPPVRRDTPGAPLVTGGGT